MYEYMYIWTIWIWVILGFGIMESLCICWNGFNCQDCLEPVSSLNLTASLVNQCFLKLFSCFETFLKQIETNCNILKCVSLFFISSFFGLHFVIENLIFKGSAHNRSMRLLNSSVAINIEQPATVY